MPEGDTIYRTAVSLQRWIGGRTVTAARSTAAGVVLGERVAGAVVERIEPRAKHLLIAFSSGWVLHTHMRMTGSWHVYPVGERWQRPASQARVVIECGDRLAVCFNAPVVELLRDSDEVVHPVLAGLGPDVLDGDIDLSEVVSRVRSRPPSTTAGEMLLDQRVVSGIGNIYRCESLFADRVDPWTPMGELDDDAIGHLVTTASRLMRASARVSSGGHRSPSGRGDRPSVYRRAGRPCPRCGTVVRAARMGDQPRTVYWCPACQRRADPNAGTKA